MNELIIAGIIGVVVVSVFGITWVVENADRIGEWLFDVGTAYYKLKLDRERKNYRQYF